MAPHSSKSRTASSESQDGGSAAIEVSANGNRRSLEALYLEICEVARKNGLKVEYQLTKSKREDLPET